MKNKINILASNYCFGILYIGTKKYKWAVRNITNFYAYFVV